MSDAGTETAIRPSSAKLVPPEPLLTARLAEKHLDAALLAVIQRRTLEQSILPGVPFH
jgi:hypothetical protein